jgi:hypothetical protein
VSIEEITETTLTPDAAENHCNLRKMVLDDDFISRIHRASHCKSKASDPPVVIIISSTLMGNP